MSTETSSAAVVVTPEALLKHWQGHRALTRRMIEAFPEDQLFSFSVGGMRTFSALAMEFIGMAAPTLNGIVSGEWTMVQPVEPTTRDELLRLWDDATADIDRLWARIPPHRFQETDTAFGQWTMPIWALIFYVIDNEIHHRGQGYVYLRALGVEPPAFWERE